MLLFSITALLTSTPVTMPVRVSWIALPETFSPVTSVRTTPFIRAEMSLLAMVTSEDFSIETPRPV